MRSVLLRMLLGISPLALNACGDPPIPVADQKATVACAMCQFKMDDAKGCTWAIELEGKKYHVRGKTPADHNDHGPDGMCNMPREATVAGEIRGNAFIAKRFDLIEAKNVPATPTYTEADKH